MPKKISFGLSVNEIDNAVKELRQYKADINRKCQIFAERLAHEGVIIAQTKIMQFPAVYTGKLLNSIKQRPGDILTNGATWYVYTDCPYAKYVEFGTGLQVAKTLTLIHRLLIGNMT
jgi:hypothetical protein